jgi:hypothetical protein
MSESSLGTKLVGEGVGALYRAGDEAPHGSPERRDFYRRAAAAQRLLEERFPDKAGSPKRKPARSKGGAR